MLPCWSQAHANLPFVQRSRVWHTPRTNGWHQISPANHNSTTNLTINKHRAHVHHSTLHLSLERSHTRINMLSVRSAPIRGHYPQAPSPASCCAPRSCCPVHVRTSRRVCLAKAIGIFYSTSSGNTEVVAGVIKEALGAAAAEPQDIGDVSDLESLKGYDALVVGAPTWNTGADDCRSGTSWDDVLAKIAVLDLAGKPVACFGCGDSISYGEYFCDAMEELHATFSAAGATMVGKWPSKGYGHHESKAETEPGQFCGLALDQDNEADLTDKRVKEWTAQVLKEVKVNA